MLKIPSFDDFLAEMGNEKSTEWCMSVDGLKICDRFPPQTVGDVQQMAAALLSASHDMTIAMLRDYHAWLVKQFSSKSVHLV